MAAQPNLLPHLHTVALGQPLTIDVALGGAGAAGLSKTKVTIWCYGHAKKDAPPSVTLLHANCWLEDLPTPVTFTPTHPGVYTVVAVAVNTADLGAGFDPKKSTTQLSHRFCVRGPGGVLP